MSLFQKQTFSHGKSEIYSWPNRRIIDWDKTHFSRIEFDFFYLIINPQLTKGWIVYCDAELKTLFYVFSIKYLEHPSNRVGEYKKHIAILFCPTTLSRLGKPMKINLKKVSILVVTIKIFIWSKGKIGFYLTNWHRIKEQTLIITVSSVVFKWSSYDVSYFFIFCMCQRTGITNLRICSIIKKSLHTSQPVHSLALLLCIKMKASLHHFLYWEH